MPPFRVGDPRAPLTLGEGQGMGWFLHGETADLLMKASSLAADLMKPPSHPYEPGGIQLNFDR